LNKNVKIVKYKEEFKEKVLSFFKNLPYEDLYNRFHGSIKDFESYIHGWGKRNGIILIAFYGSRVIGICEAYPIDKEWEAAIIVDREFRRRGVGKELLKRISKQIFDRGGKALYGLIHKGNRGAIEFSRNIGCKIIDIDSQTVKVYFDLSTPT